MTIKLYDPNHFPPEVDQYRRIHEIATLNAVASGGKTDVKLNEGPEGLAPEIHVLRTNDVTLAYTQINLGASVFEATGSAKRHPKDSDDKEYGRALALKRMFEESIQSIDHWLTAADQEKELNKIGGLEQIAKVLQVTDHWKATHKGVWKA